MFAHLLRGKWLLANTNYPRIENKLQAALEHFESARKSGQKPTYVDEQIWYSLAHTHVEGVPGALLGFCNEYRMLKRP